MPNLDIKRGQTFRWDKNSLTWMPQSNAQPFKPPISNYEEHLFSNNSSLEVFHLSSQSDFPDAVVVLDGAGDDVRDLLRHHPDRTPWKKKRQTALNEVVEIKEDLLSSFKAGSAFVKNWNNTALWNLLWYHSEPVLDSVHVQNLGSILNSLKYSF